MEQRVEEEKRGGGERKGNEVEEGERERRGVGGGGMTESRGREGRMFCVILGTYRLRHKTTCTQVYGGKVIEILQVMGITVGGDGRGGVRMEQRGG